MRFIAIVSVGLFIAYANGANDNLKGVATLFGSGTTSYPRAVAWATITTLLGSVAALALGGGLLDAFGGKGIVPASVAHDPTFVSAVALATGVTVLSASWLGFPISTTHALVGALLGAGRVASAPGIDDATLAAGFMVPLLLSPVMALVGASFIYGTSRLLRRWLRPTAGRRLGPMAPRDRAIVDATHYLSGGAVSFARGLNDTPKIAALLVAGGVVQPPGAIGLVAMAMAAGGILGARRVGETMAHRVTALNPGRGLIANAVTSLFVIGASALSMPVSTTHVSCGSLFGVGAASGHARGSVIGRILLAWVTTVPMAALAAAMLVLVARVIL